MSASCGKNQRDAAGHFAGRIFGNTAGSGRTVSWMKEECGLDDSGAEQMIEYVLQGRAVLGQCRRRRPSSRNDFSMKAVGCSW